MRHTFNEKEFTWKDYFMTWLIDILLYGGIFLICAIIYSIIN
jgi:hypothetical protein